MPRSRPSPADQELVAAAHDQGVMVTTRQVERWRASGLLPPNVRMALGRGRGSRSVAGDGAAELVVWLGKNVRRGQRPGDLALLAFGAGQCVPERTVRRAFAHAPRRVQLSVERDFPPGTAAEDVADAAVCGRAAHRDGA